MTLEMLTREFRDRLNEEFKDSIRFTMQDSKDIIATLCGMFSEELIEEGSTKIPNIGSFKVKLAKGRVGRNPSTGEALEYPDTHKAKFTATKELKKAISDKFDN
jgi:nucleoid DNA-binding protein